jgi:hypothetical protein
MRRRFGVVWEVQPFPSPTTTSSATTRGSPSFFLYGMFLPHNPKNTEPIPGTPWISQPSPLVIVTSCRSPPITACAHLLIGHSAANSTVSQLRPLFLILVICECTLEASERSAARPKLDSLSPQHSSRSWGRCHHIPYLVLSCVRRSFC